MDKKDQLKEIKLDSGIHNIAEKMRFALIDGIVLDDESKNVLLTFRRKYDFDEDISSRGKDVVLQEITEALENIDFEKAEKAVSEGISITQEIYPSIKITPFPIVFLSIPTQEDAKSLFGQGCAINIQVFNKPSFPKEDIYKTISSFVAHETTHMFLKQLDRKPEYKTDSIQDQLGGFLWEEGLTTYVETIHYPHHYEFIKEADFWLDVIHEWFATSDNERKRILLKSCIDSQSCKSWMEGLGYTIEYIIDTEEDIDDQFLELFTTMNGAGYHIGAYLWEKQISDGNELEDLIMEGGSKISEWIEDAVE